MRLAADAPVLLGHAADVLSDKADDGAVGDLQGVLAAVHDVDGDGLLLFVGNKHDIGIGGVDAGADVGGDGADGVVVDDAV